jgi:6-phosphofructokinase 1
MTRIPGEFDPNEITSERVQLWKCLEKGECLSTYVSTIGDSTIANPRLPEEVGKYRSPYDEKLVTADFDLLQEYEKRGMEVPRFREAGPRELLYHSPESVKAAIVTTGGLAPGLNCVVHSIVDRHWNTYRVSPPSGGDILGVFESFLGACNLDHYMKSISPANTENWLDKGGSILGVRRTDRTEGRETLAQNIAYQLKLKKINILYVIGGDGTLGVAHEIAKIAKDVSVVGIPKTMDNDVMWVWQSFGFRTAVEKAAEVINTLNAEAESTRRVCLIELFGAESGFVAANATLASGHVDLVLIPEEFQSLTTESCEKALDIYLEYLKARVQNPRRRDERPHGVVVVAEGVAKILHAKNVKLAGVPIAKDDLVVQLKDYLKDQVRDGADRNVEVFYNQPRHNIRAIPANAQDQIYCERLGALAVDNALAGYTDFMISQWLTEYVLVPLEIVQDRHKRIPTAGVFWKQVVNSTGQPCIWLKKYGLKRIVDEKD